MNLGVGVWSGFILRPFHTPRRWFFALLHGASMKRMLLLTAAMAMSLVGSASAEAGGLNFINRHLGLGWSEGYHASCECDNGCGKCSSCKLGKGCLNLKSKLHLPGKCRSAKAPAAPKCAPAPALQKFHGG